MTPLDVAIIMVTTVLIVFGYVKGAVRQIFTILGIVIGFLVALQFSNTLAQHLVKAVRSQGLSQIVAFSLFFLLTAVVFYLIGTLLKEVIRVSFLGFFDRLLGAVVGLAIGLLVSWAITMLVAYAGDSGRATVRDSAIAPTLLEMGSYALQLLPEEVQETIEVRAGKPKPKR